MFFSIDMPTRLPNLCVSCHTTIEQPSHNNRTTVTQQRNTRHTVEQPTVRPTPLVASLPMTKIAIA